ncbi:hypothetical protein Dsin_003717 [Dipteronia sinensis]|uniref:RNase H type-1 domain-containing protein n=1 Tax=Dipteronia sinensis TaxID=43782 RepID=A0AAE0B834_9ROSI|nr:hypothetical protein Dsin_003717 [Dipteronia sinensis]
MVFKGLTTVVSQAEDMVKFRGFWWFKHFGRGSKLSISIMLLNIKESCLDVNRVKSVKSSEWLPPTGEGLKFNVDGSLRDNPGKAGIEGVLRDSGGKVWGLFSAFVGILDSMSAEILAIQRAAFMCVHSEVLVGKEVDIVSDSKAAVAWVNSEGFCNLRHVDVIYDIRNSLNFLGNTRVIFNSRASNSYANMLAKKGMSAAKSCLLATSSEQSDAFRRRSAIAPPQLRR